MQNDRDTGRVRIRMWASGLYVAPPTEKGDAMRADVTDTRRTSSEYPRPRRQNVRRIEYRFRDLEGRIHHTVLANPVRFRHGQRDAPDGVQRTAEGSRALEKGSYLRELRGHVRRIGGQSRGEHVEEEDILFSRQTKREIVRERVANGEK